ncbi:MAG: SDR family NAD(P)-dependent oxidoreductase [Cyclobacteriaceae bacterium]|nr:SDR family NAD(P)-dependent oxidoreductase [Cyclobacteriaceae bacterium]
MNILITGANKGIGFETARQLGLQGHRIILSGRDEARLDKAAKALSFQGVLMDTLMMDVHSAESIETAAKTFSNSTFKLDVLINNAAQLDKADNSLLRDDERILSETLTTNSVGPLRVIRAFLPYLNTPGARIINLSSGGGSMTDPVGGWSPAYCVSKSLLNAITRHLAHELEPKRITVNAVCPGWVKTDMGGKSAPRGVERGAETVVWLATTRETLTGKFFRDKKVIPW